MAAEQQKSECDEEGGTEIAGGRTSRHTTADSEVLSWEPDTCEAEQGQERHRAWGEAGEASRPGGGDKREPCGKGCAAAAQRSG